MIEVKGLTKYYGKKLGVEDINFHIDKGEVVGLLGPNGAGKSTIMKMLSGYQIMTSGSIEIDGIDVLDNAKEYMEKIGFMPENPPLYKDMTVEKFLVFSSAVNRQTKEEIAQNVKRVMNLADISHVKDRRIGNLSKGYKQRVGIAQVLLNMPPVIILDEPTSGLDPKQITEVRELINSLKKDHTIIVSSHILAEISQLCQRVIIINQGHLVADSDLEELRNNKGESDRVFIKSTASLEEIKVALEKQGIPLMDISKSEVSLEEIFLNLTNV